MQQNAPTSSDIAREVKSFVQGLKESAKKNDPWDKEIEFQRKQLRAQYLRLLLVYPFAKETKEAETHLWMQTSYQFIAKYKQRIAALDKMLFPAQKGPQKGPRHEQNNAHNEYRRILNRFRQFLAEEEKFYTQLLVKFCKRFDLAELQHALSVVELRSVDQEQSERAEPHRNVFPEEREVLKPTAAQHDGRLTIFSKLLVCLGDISRYREQYNDGGGRPRAGHEEGTPRKASRGGKRPLVQDVMPRARNYNRARQVYELAHRVVPDDGNASHQLAILASYQKDVFASLLYYYRSLCVRQPYDPATDNFMVLLKKALDRYAANRDLSGETDGEKGAEVARARVDKFMDWVVVLHGLWYVDSDENASRAAKHARNVIKEFAALISERALTDKIIKDVVVLSMGALWKLRMIRDPGIQTDSKRNKVVESLMTAHILELSRTLLQSGYVQLAEQLESMQGQDDLAQNITAAFRRTVPAIRIMSKWLLSNFSYIESAASSAVTPSFLSQSIKGFWKTYAGFFTALRRTFPPDQLPALTAPLEEDVEMNGFSPIKRRMFKPSLSTELGFEPGQSQVHPNEEYLMRIADLLRDAVTISENEKSPVRLSNGKFIYSELESQPADVAPSLTSQAVDTLATIMESHPDPPRPRDTDDDSTTQASRTEDDPVRDAFRVTVDSPNVNGDVDDDDEIVIYPREVQASLGQLAQPIQSVQPPVQASPPSLTPTKPTPRAMPARALPSPMFGGGGTTAQDLLNNVLGLPRSSSDPHHPFAGASSTAQPSLLFGSGSPIAPTKSIWSNTGAEAFMASRVARPAMLQQQRHATPPPPAHGRSLSFNTAQDFGFPYGAAVAQAYAEGGLTSAPLYSTGTFGQLATQDRAVPPSPLYQTGGFGLDSHAHLALGRAQGQGQTQAHGAFGFSQQNGYGHDDVPYSGGNEAYLSYARPVSRPWGNT